MAKFASAEQLVVEIVLFQQLVPTFLQTTFAPILRPEMYRLMNYTIRWIFICHLFRFKACRIHLV